MSKMENSTNLFSTNKKSLFSLQVDDIIIQRMFKDMQDEIRRLSDENSRLIMEVSKRPTIDQVLKLENDVNDLKGLTNNWTSQTDEKFSTFQKVFEEGIEKTKILVRDQIADTIFSVNNAIRAQNTLIEEKVLEMNRPQLEYNALRSDVDHVMEVSKIMTAKVSFVTEFFSGFLNSKSFENGTPKIKLQEIIDNAMKPLKEDVNTVHDNINELESRIIKAENVVRQISDGSEELPIFGEVIIPNFSQKPKLKKMPPAMNFIDYFKYLMDFAPQVHGILNSFYDQIMIISNSLYDQKEFRKQFDELDKSTQILNNLKDQFLNIQNGYADKSDLDSLRNSINLLSSKCSKIDEISSLEAEINKLRANLVTKYDIINAVDDLRNQISVDIENITNHLNVIENKTTPSSSSTSAVTVVTPRGGTSYRAIYSGDKNSERPSTTYGTRTRTIQVQCPKPSPEELGPVKKSSSKVRIKYKTEQVDLAELTPISRTISSDQESMASYGLNSSHSKSNLL